MCLGTLLLSSKSVRWYFPWLELLDDEEFVCQIVSVSIPSLFPRISWLLCLLSHWSRFFFILFENAVLFLPAIAPFTEIQAGLSSSPLVSPSQQPSPHTDQIGNEAQRVSSSTPGHISQDLGNLYSCTLQFSLSVVSDYLHPHGPQHARLPCPSPTPRACSNSCPSSRWYHPTISSSVIHFSSCPQSFPAWGSFPMSQLFASSGQRTVPLTPD